MSLTGVEVLLRHHVRTVGTEAQTVALAHGFGSAQKAGRPSQPARFAKLIRLDASPHYRDAGSYQGGFAPSDGDGPYAAMAANYHTRASHPRRLPKKG